jgi:nicotinamide mononucleotide transporter
VNGLPGDTLGSVLAYAAANRLEATGAIAGLVCVWLLIRQSLWTWPLGLYYSVVSVYLFADARLVGQVCLNAYFAVMNAWGWYLWLRGRADREAPLEVTRTAAGTLAWLLVASAAGVLFLATAFDLLTAARLPHLDFSVAVLSVAAMWLQARKKLESWVFWICVNVASVALFLASANYFYLVLYLIYVPMAISGYVAWRRSMAPAHVPA